MQTIQALSTFPSGTPIDAVQVRITKLFKREIKSTAYGEKSKQDGVIQDSTGEIKFSAWEHPELESILGREVVIHASGSGKGLKTYVYKDKSSLEVGKTGQFQHVAVYAQTKGLPEQDKTQGVSAPTPTPPKPVAAKETAKAGHGPIHGATAGLATNKAVDILIASGLINKLTLEQDILEFGGAIARAALRLESGELNAGNPDVKTPSNTAKLASEPVNEDVPF